MGRYSANTAQLHTNPLPRRARSHIFGHILTHSVTLGAGTGSPGHTDGPPYLAQMHFPSGVARRNDGRLVVADYR